MLCFLCGKKIGSLRSLVDQQYCSKEHRAEARLASARALRDEEDLEPWAVAKSKSKKKQQARSGATAGQAASVFAFLTVAGLLAAVLILPGSGGGGPAFPSVSADPTVKRGLFQRAGDALGSLVRSSAPVTLRHDFKTGLSDWA